MKAPSHANEAAVNPNQRGRRERINPTFLCAVSTQWSPPLRSLTGNY